MNVDEFDLDDLFSELEDIQNEEKKPTHRFKIANESVADLMELMIENKMFGDEKMFFTGKKEYVLRNHLKGEITSHIKALGRVNLSSLELLLDVDISIIKSILSEVPNTVTIKQEIFSKTYLDQLVSEIHELLKVKGSCTIQQLCEEYSVSMSFFTDFFIPDQLFAPDEPEKVTEKKRVKIIRKKNFLYTSKYNHRLESTVRGFFTSVLSPIRIDSPEFLSDLVKRTTFSNSSEGEETMSSFPQISSSQCKKIIQKMVKSGRLCGRFLGETFFPRIFDDRVEKEIKNFLNQNYGCMSYDYIRDNFLPFRSEKELIRYLKQNIFHQKKNNDNQIRYFENCVVFSDLMEIKVGVLIQNAMDEKKCVDLTREANWLKYFTEEEKENWYESLFGFDEEDNDDLGLDEEEEEEEEEEEDGFGRYRNKVKVIEDVIVPKRLIHEDFFSEECQKNIESKFRNLIKKNIPVERIKVDTRDIANAIGYEKFRSSDDEEEKTFFLGEVKNKIVDPFLRKMFEKFKEENKSIGNQFQGDRERKRKLTIKKVEEKISKIYFDLCIFSQGLEGFEMKLTSNRLQSTDPIKIRGLFNQLHRCLVQNLGKKILDEITELKILEYRVSNHKLPQEEDKIIRKLRIMSKSTSTNSSAPKCIEELKEKCVNELNVYLSPFTKRNKKMKIREKKEYLERRLQRNNLFKFFKEDEDDIFGNHHLFSVHEIEKVVMDGFPRLVQFLILKVTGQLVYFHGKHVKKILECLDEILELRDLEDLKNKFLSCSELVKSYILMKNKFNSLQVNQLQYKQQQGGGASGGGGRRKKKKKPQTNFSPKKGRRKNKRKKGKKKWTEDFSSEEEDEECRKVETDRKMGKKNQREEEEEEEEPKTEELDETFQIELDKMKIQLMSLKEDVLKL